MKQFEAVITTMENLGGLATLAQLYQNVDGSNWKTKTPFATIRRIVQDDRFFFKIKPGLWALKSYKNEISRFIPLDNSKSNHEKEIFNHSYYQGLLIEIGNMSGYDTFIPNQDKNKQFLKNKLGDYSTLKKIHNFTYDTILDRARTIDVIWFNDKKFPKSFFEIEHSTDFQNSLLKMTDLKYFYADFYIVADTKRYREFEKKITHHVFGDMKGRIKFISYEKLSEHHSNAYKYFNSSKELQL